MRKVTKGIFIGIGISIAAYAINELWWSYKAKKVVCDDKPDIDIPAACKYLCNYRDKCGAHVFANYDECVEKYGKDVMEFIEREGVTLGDSVAGCGVCLEVLSYKPETGTIFAKVIESGDYVKLTYDPTLGGFLAEKVEV